MNGRGWCLAVALGFVVVLACTVARVRSAEDAGRAVGGGAFSSAALSARASLR